MFISDAEKNKSNCRIFLLERTQSENMLITVGFLMKSWLVSVSASLVKEQQFILRGTNFSQIIEMLDSVKDWFVKTMIMAFWKHFPKSLV